MNRKAATTSIVISVFLVLALTGLQVVEVCRADPFPFKIMDEVPPDNSTQPPTIEFLSPRNSTSYNINDLILSVVAEVGFSSTAAYAPHPYISEVYYKIDNQMTSTTVYKYGQPQYGTKTFSKYNVTIPLNGISEGNHAITVYAVENGRYESNNGSTILYYPFKITGSSNSYFAVDNTVPNITNLSIENKTYTSTEIPLIFNVNDEASKLVLGLDNKANITITGNTTLTDLIDGSHSLVIYANDTAGNMGKSNTVFFIVNTQPIPTPTPTPSMSPLASPTQQPTLEPSATPIVDPPIWFTPNSVVVIFLAATLFAVVAISIVIYFRKKGNRKRNS